MKTLRVGIIGGGWMGHVHARAYQRVNQHWSDLPLTATVVALAEPNEEAAADFTARFPETKTVRNWQELVTEPSIDAVSVTAPNHLHAQIGSAVAESGKHLWIEKPVGLSLADAERVREAVSTAGVVGLVAFNYRNVPAIAEARELLNSGAIGVPTHARVSLLTDYAAQPGSPLSWRYETQYGGHGVLGDLASHGVAMLRHLLGEVEAVSAQTAIHIPRRPIVPVSGHYATVDLSQRDLDFGRVENEDYIVSFLRMKSGALAVCEASRSSVGEQNNYSVEVHGTQGLVRWDFRRPGELHVSRGAHFAAQPTEIRFSAPGDGQYAAFQPGSGIAMSYDDTKVIEAMQFPRAIGGQEVSHATLDDAVASASILEAMVVASSSSNAWIEPS